MADRKIVVLDPYSKENMAMMQKAAGTDFEMVQLSGSSEEEIKAALKEAEVVVGAPPMQWILSKEDCPNLRFLQMSWAGTDMYTQSTIPFPKERIMLANGSGGYGMIMSQFVVGMALSVMLNFGAYHTQQQQEIWQRRGPVQSLDHKKVLIFGAGDIGSAVAKRLQGFDCTCIGVCRDVSKSRGYFDVLCTLENAEQYLPEVDVVVGCIPNVAETKGYLNADRIYKMKKGSVLVNVGRGNFIDCMALDKALTEEHLWGAALDVTDPEPLPVGHPLWKNPRCMITPHCSGASFGSLMDTENLLREIVCENLGRYGRGEEIRNRVL